MHTVDDRQERQRLYRDWSAAWQELKRASARYATLAGDPSLHPLRPAVREDSVYQALKLAESKESVAWAAFESLVGPQPEEGHPSAYEAND